MVNISENNGTEEIGLVTATQNSQTSIWFKVCNYTRINP